MIADPLDFLDQPSIEKPRKVSGKKEPRPPINELDESAADDPLSFLEKEKEKPSKLRGRLSAYPKGFMRSGRKINPLQMFSSPIPDKLAEKTLQEYLPTEDEPIQNILETAGELSPLMIGGPEGLGAKALQVLGGSLGKEGLKQAGAPEWAQELGTYGGMGVATAAKGAFSKSARTAGKWSSLEKMAKGNSAKQEIIDFGKLKNLTPEETTLLLQSNGKIDTLGKIAKHNKKSKSILEGLNKKLGNSYNELKKLGRQGGYLSLEEAEALQKDFQGIADEMGKTLMEGPDTKGARKVLEEAIENLDNRPNTIEELINTRRNIRQSANWKNVDEGAYLKNKINKSLFNAIERKNPRIAKELKNTDEAWAKYKRAKKELEKKGYIKRTFNLPLDNLAAQIAFGAVGAAIGGSGLALKAVAGKEIIQRLSTRLLTDPKLQGLHRKMLNLLKYGPSKDSKGLLLAYLKILKKEDPEEADELEKLLKDLESSY